MTVYLTYY